MKFGSGDHCQCQVYLDIRTLQLESELSGFTFSSYWLLVLIYLKQDYEYSAEIDMVICDGVC